MRLPLHSIVLSLATLLAAGAAQPQTPAVSAADAKDVRAVIEAQLDAFAADDAIRAMSYAAPPIRQMFGTAENFIGMVRQGYPVVYRPASVTFLKPEMIEGELIQSVQMTDAGGQVWLALYQMQRQGDRSWRINGCQVVASRDRVT